MGQTIMNGIDAIRPMLAAKRFLLVRDAAFGSLPIRDFFSGLDAVPFAEFTPNPLYEQVCEGVELFRRSGCELIVAVGGGSAMDVAKCIKLYCRMDPAVNYLKQPMQDTGVPLIAVPTTAGTGSEATRHAVIYYDGEKQSVSHPSIVPDAAVLEPTVLKTLPLYQKKCTMMDALCQAIESWWSVGSNDESIGYSRRAVEMIRDNWEAYIFADDEDAAARIMEAANLAGRAINITATTAAHAMSYKLTSMFRLPHGHAVAVCLPEVWNYMLDHTADCIDPRGEEHLTARLDEIASLLSPAQFRDMMDRLALGGPTCADPQTKLDTLAASVNPVRLKNNPVALSAEVLKDMYRRIVKHEG